MPQPTHETLRQRNLLGVNDETVTNITPRDFPGHYTGEDHSWNIEELKNNLKIQFHKNDPYDAVFSLIGVDPSIANAFRRILLSELPSLAIEKVFIENNTCIIQDEVLSHRLGLIPLKGNVEGLRWLKWMKNPTEEDPESGVRADFNTVMLKLDVECTWKEDGEKKLRQGITDPAQLYNNAHVYASHLKFAPIGQQKTLFSPTKGPIEPVIPDILVAKLRPGQTINLTCYAELGIGADHAKFSPVATASYRLLPVIDIRQPILGEDAIKFQKCFLPGVIELEKVTDEEASQEAYKGYAGQEKAVVADAMRDTVSRECLRHDEFKDKVKLGRQRDHFIFSVESTGQWESDEMFADAIKLLKRKCARIQRDFTSIRATGCGI